MKNKPIKDLSIDEHFIMMIDYLKKKFSYSDDKIAAIGNMSRSTFGKRYLHPETVKLNEYKSIISYLESVYVETDTLVTIGRQLGNGL